MAAMTGKRRKTKSNRASYPNLRGASIALGVTYEHLWQCVSGRRKSASLMARFREFKKLRSIPLMNIAERIGSLETLLKDTRAKIAAVRAEDPSGSVFGTIYHDLQRHEQLFKQHLEALRKQIPQAAVSAGPAQDSTPDNSPEDSES
jgi:hypothetical protein